MVSRFEGAPTRGDVRLIGKLISEGLVEILTWSPEPGSKMRTTEIDRAQGKLAEGISLALLWLRGTP